MNLVLIVFAVLFAAGAPVKAHKTATPAAVSPAAVKEAPVLIDSRFPRKSDVAPWEKTNADEPISTVQTC